MIGRIIDNLYKFSNFTIDIYNKHYFKNKYPGNFPKFVGLMISRVCGGGCVYCPVHRYNSPKKPFMSVEIAKKVAKELKEENFKGTINFGENGDALLNPQFKEIFEEMSKVDGGHFILFTNMDNMDEETARFLLENGLNEITFNLDGATKETYEAAKTGCNFDEVVKNAKNFIKLRNEINLLCKIHIKAIPAKRYLEYRENKKSDTSYDFPKLNKIWWPLLIKKHDTITEGRYFGSWGTYNFFLKQRTIPCATVTQQADICYIDTEGSMYSCCVDYKTTKTFGNVMEKSIFDIWHSDNRKWFYKHVIYKNYKCAGQPCINCGEKNDYVGSYLNYLRYKILKR